LGEDLAYFHSRVNLDEPIEIDETTAQFLRKVSPHSALPDGHEPDKRDVLRRRFRQGASEYPIPQVR
jgi:hypothetical protein